MVALWPSLQKTLSAGWGWILDAVLSSVRSRLKTKSGNVRSMECSWPLITTTSDLTAKGQAPWEGLMYTAWWVNLIEGRWGLGYRAPPPPRSSRSASALPWREHRSLLLRGLVETLTEWGEPLKHSNMV